MSEPLRGVIVSHAAVAQALLAAVAAITGVRDALVPVSNDGCDTGALADRLNQAIDNKPAVLFVDLPGGSCLTSSVRLARGKTDVAVVTGVNLAMLLDFVFHRDLPPGDAARRAAEAGGRANPPPPPRGTPRIASAIDRFTGRGVWGGGERAKGGVFVWWVAAC